MSPPRRNAVSARKRGLVAIRDKTHSLINIPSQASYVAHADNCRERIPSGDTSMYIKLQTENQMSGKR